LLVQILKKVNRINNSSLFRFMLVSFQQVVRHSTHKS